MQPAPRESPHIQALVETEANARPMPEFDSTDNGIREMHSGGTAVGELDHNSIPKPITELATFPPAQELQAREVAAAELKGSSSFHMLPNR